MTIKFLKQKRYNGRVYGANAVITLPDNDGKVFLNNKSAVIHTNPINNNSHTSPTVIQGLSASQKSKLDSLPNFYIQATEPSSPAEGDIWIQTT